MYCLFEKNWIVFHSDPSKVQHVYCIPFGILNTSFNIKSDLEATNPFKALNLFFSLGISAYLRVALFALQQLATAEECIADK